MNIPSVTSAVDSTAQCLSRRSASVKCVSTRPKCSPSHVVMTCIRKCARVRRLRKFGPGAAERDQEWLALRVRWARWLTSPLGRIARRTTSASSHPAASSCIRPSRPPRRRSHGSLRSPRRTCDSSLCGSSSSASLSRSPNQQQPRNKNEPTARTERPLIHHPRRAAFRRQVPPGVTLRAVDLLVLPLRRADLLKGAECFVALGLAVLVQLAIIHGPALRPGVLPARDVRKEHDAGVEKHEGKGHRPCPRTRPSVKAVRRRADQRTD